MHAARLAIASLILLAAGPAAADWPQYRGPRGDAVANGDGVFDRPGFGLRVAWKRPLGSGYSSVAVANGRVVTVFSDRDQDTLAAFDQRSGKELWRHATGPVYVGHDGSHDGALSTPVVAGSHVVTLTPGGRLLAVKARNGEPAWSVDLAEEYSATAPFYGFGMSPLFVDGVVVLQTGGDDSAVSGFAVKTGERLWTAGSDRMQYQSPALLQHGGETLVVAAGGQNVYGIRPRTGEVVWEYAHEGGGNAYGAAGLTPVPAGDGRLFLTHKNESSKMIRLGGSGSATRFETLWENRNIRHSYNSAVYHGGHLYGYSSRFLICVDAETGESRWRSRAPGDGFLMLVDGYLVVVTREGSVHVAPASSSGYRESASVRVFDELAWSPPSSADGAIFARSLGELARVEVSARPTRSASDDGSGPDLSDTRFGGLLTRLDRTSNKAAAIDEFLASADSFPIVEDGELVHVVYRGPAQDVAIAGDLIGVALEQSMTRVEGTDLFYYSTRMEPDARVNYVLIVDYEQVLDPLNPRQTTTDVVGEDMELTFGGEPMEVSWFSMPEWKAPAFLRAPESSRRGRLESIELESEVLGGAELPLEVYLPRGYDEGESRYPVVYVHGGDAAREQGDWTTALDNLIGESVAPLIAVFIGPLRARLPQYAEMFSEELVPLVDRRFRTIADAGARAHFGAGFGGVTALFCTVKHPELTRKAGAQGAFLTEFAWDPIEPLIETAAEQPLDLYLDWGRYALRNHHENWNIADANRRAVRYLRQRGYEPAGGEVHEGPGWASWRNRTDRVLQALFPR